MNKAKLEKEGRLPRSVECLEDMPDIISEYDDPEIVFEESELQRDVAFIGKVSSTELEKLVSEASQALQVTREDLEEWEAGGHELDDGGLEEWPENPENTPEDMVAEEDSS